MGIYEILFRFAAASKHYMGDPGTHPWAQGFPLTVQIPGGPSLPEQIAITAEDRMYPKADGQPPLREAIARYYNEAYGSKILAENVAVFAGGRPAIFAILAFLTEQAQVLIEETEYTPYFDMLHILGKEPHLIPSNPGNRFRPTLADHPSGPNQLLIKSNPCNPTGVTLQGASLAELVKAYSQPGKAALIDEAYEFFMDPEPESALAHIDDIDTTDLFVVGAATKGLQVPGLRVGWVVASQANIELFRNYSSFGMGGVSRASQLYVTELLESERVQKARLSVAKFYTQQRELYGEGLAKLGFELFTGSGGFYHWGTVPGGSTADELNGRLFKENAGILPGRLCDMARRGEHGALGSLARFSFGPLAPGTVAKDMELLARCL